MDDERYENIITAVIALAQAEGAPLSMQHVCRSCRAALDADGVALFLASDTAPVEPALATDPVSEHLAETQAMLGEGPAVDCLNIQGLVSAPELSTRAVQAQWPLFAPTTVTAGIHGVTAFPLVMGVIPIGVLQVHHGHPSGLTSIQLRDGRLFAQLVLALLMEHTLTQPESDIRDALLADGLQARWARVNQAVGMVAEQLGSGMTEACLRLRATALAQDRRVSDVATDVLASRLRYDPDRR